MHHMDADKVYKEKDRQELRKNATSHIKQIPQSNTPQNSSYTDTSSWCNGWSDALRNRSTQVRTPVALLRSLSGKYPWERYEPPYSPSSYG